MTLRDDVQNCSIGLVILFGGLLLSVLFTGHQSNRIAELERAAVTGPITAGDELGHVPEGFAPECVEWQNITEQLPSQEEIDHMYALQCRIIVCAYGSCNALTADGSQVACDTEQECRRTCAARFIRPVNITRTACVKETLTRDSEAISIVPTPTSPFADTTRWSS